MGHPTVLEGIEFKAFVGFAPSFSAQVRLGEPGAPVLSLCLSFRNPETFPSRLPCKYMWRRTYIRPSCALAYVFVPVLQVFF
jgi:hypothetical protein